MKFKELIEAISEYKIYIEGNTFWVAYGQGSGTTAYNLDMKKYLNDDKADKDHYDDIVRTIKKFEKTAKPIKSVGNMKLYAVPVYERSEYGQTLDVWGGNKKSYKTFYMTVTDEKSTIVNFFEKKGEALNWLKHTNEDLNEMANGFAVSIPWDELKNGDDSLDSLEKTANKYYGRNDGDVNIQPGGSGDDISISSSNLKEFKHFLRKTGFGDFIKTIVSY